MSKTSIWQSLFTKKMLICIFTGFSSGLPLYILVSLLPAWLRSEGVNLKAIGLFALINLPFTWKFLWAPFFDCYIPPLGRRRGWLIISQVLLLVSIPVFGAFNPQLDIWTIAYLATVVAFFSASQDIVLDAYRRELIRPSRAGAFGRARRSLKIHTTTRGTRSTACCSRTSRRTCGAISTRAAATP